MKTSYPNVQGLRYASEPKLSNLKITDSGTKNNGYLSKDSTISIACDYSFEINTIYDAPLPINDYDINVTVNGINVPKDSIVIDSQNKKIKVNDLVFAAPRYAMNGKTGTFNVEVSMKDKLGHSSNVSDSIKVDLEAPTIRKIAAKWVDGENGKVFIGTEYTGKPTISFAPVEKGSMFKSAKVKSGNTELPLSYTFDFSNGLIYTVDFTGYNEVTPVFYVEDANGNIGEYSLSQVLGSAGNTAIIGLPTVDFTMEGGTLVGNWYKGNSLTLKATATNNLGGISKVVYKIGNNEEVTSNVSGKTHQFSENVTHLADNNGILDVSVSVYDNNSNVHKVIKQFKIDNVEPVLNNKSISGKYSVYDKTAYVNGELTISGEVAESQSGLKIVKIYKNGFLDSNNLPYKITDNGVYSVQLVDNVGNEKVYNLSDFFGKDVDKIVFSKNTPSISIESLSGGVKIDGIDWYKSLDTVKYSVKCDNLLSTEVKVKNGSSETKLEPIKGTGESYSVSLIGLKDGINTITFKVKDKSGLETSKELVIGVDNSKPIVKNVKIDDSYKDILGFLWFTKEPTVTIDASDKITDIKEYIVIGSGGERIEKNNKVKLCAGDHAIKVVDSVGNVSDVVELKDMWNSKFGTIGIDNSKPVVNSVKVDDSYIDQFGFLWFKEEPTVTIDASDSLTDIKEYIVIGSDGERIEKNNKVKLCAGDHAIKVVDPLGNVSDVVELKDMWNSEFGTIAIDNSKPVVNSVKVDDSYIDQFGFLWFKEEPTVTIDASDSLTDIKEYIIIGSDGERIEKNNKVKMCAGDHAIKVVDSVGNVSDVVELKDMWNSESGIIAVDGDKPIIDCTKPDGNVKGWYSKDVTFKASVSDNLGINSATMTINGVEVDSLDVSKLILSGNLSGSTASISPKEDGSYDIKIVVSDNAGNTSEWSDIIYIDKKASSKDSIETGDNTNLALWIALILFSVAGIIGVTAYYRRKRINE